MIWPVDDPHNTVASDLGAHEPMDEIDRWDERMRTLADELRDCDDDDYQDEED